MLRYIWVHGGAYICVDQIPELLPEGQKSLPCLESQRRDAEDPAHAQQLQRFVKRMRKAGYDLKKIL